MKRQIPIGMVLAAMLLAAGFASCTKPLASARVKPEVDYVSRTYAAVPNDIYYAARWALVEAGYSVGSENLADGVLTTAWQPVRSSSHYIPLFNRKDFGVTNSYHQLEIRILPGDGRAEVAVFRPANGYWAIRLLTTLYFGAAGDRPVPADYDGEGADDAGIFRDGTGMWNARALTRVYLGSPGDIPVTR